VYLLVLLTVSVNGLKSISQREHLMTGFKQSFMVLSFVLLTCFSTQSAHPEEPAAQQKADSPAVIAYYFHGTFRCPTCLTIEQLSKDAIEKNFQKQLKNGTLMFLPINVDEPENRHFIDDYQLVTRSLVITKVQGNKQVAWKNLNKVWQLVQSKEKFEYYVKSEIEKFLQGS